MVPTAILHAKRMAVTAYSAVEMRVRGRVQGVGFRPTVWRIAHQLGLDGNVCNDTDGVLIRIAGPDASLNIFRTLLECERPPLARIDSIEVVRFAGRLERGFSIIGSVGGVAHTQVAPDARICDACADEITNPANRRFGYALTNCTNCGPRLSIIRAIPYDRSRTTMVQFQMCETCLAEYHDPADRRFHAEPICCPVCGPVVACRPTGQAEGGKGTPISLAAECLERGEIIAIKGLGGYQLACDATNAQAVARLRKGKRREGKPFALMARDLAVIRNYCAVSPEEADQLASPAAPIVLLQTHLPRRLPTAIAPGLAMLGFMLPSSPLHLLLLRDFSQPVVMTSGNLADEPQIIEDDQACEQFAGIASQIVSHNRAIANRIDDSVIRFMEGKPRVIRRARGYAPSPLRLPAGFENAPVILAMGGEVKATFCLIKPGEAILSQHQGDLENPAAFDDYRKNIGLYSALFDHIPQAIAADMHPEYLSSKLARTMPGPLVEVQHHHAHIAACLCENAYPLDAPPVLGIALDGLGWGNDGTLWGGEFLLADYSSFHRLAAFKPVAMPGGVRAVREPWRNLYAHISAAMGWETFSAEFARLEAFSLLEPKPRATLDAMIARGLNAPAASSCGRLFDAVAAALGLCADHQTYEGDVAARLEALAQGGQNDTGRAYTFALSAGDTRGFHILDPAPMWRGIFEDLATGIPAPIAAARFHRGLAESIVFTCLALAGEKRFRTVAISGGCFQNALLFEATSSGLRKAGFTVLTHAQVPANDGGLALGQGMVAAAQLTRQAKGISLCA